MDMFPTSDANNRVLTKSFYRTLFNYFYEACPETIQAILSECTLGIAPGQDGRRTFFIVAPNQEIAEALTEQVDSIVQLAARLMPGVDQTAICFVPVEHQQAYQSAAQDLSQCPTKFMLGKIFPNPSETMLEN